MKKTSPDYLIRFLLPIALILTMAAFIGCSDDPTDPEENDDPPSTPTTIHVDSGEVGLVIDTRSIFKMGYLPQTAAVSLDDYPGLGGTFDVDPNTQYAFMSIPVDSLDETTLTDLMNGTGIQVTINGPDKEVLAQIADNALIDESNAPLSVETSLPFLPRPVKLETDMPYLIQMQGMEYLFSWDNAGQDQFEIDRPYTIDDARVLFYFEPVEGQESTYTFYIDASSWQLVKLTMSGSDTQYLFWDHDHMMTAWEFELIPNADGWVRFEDPTTGEYLCLGEEVDPGSHKIMLGTGEPLWFRLISDSIDWAVDDLGTIFNQPIMPPAQMDFAYQGELHNCADGELTDSIGTVDERTWQVTSSTTEGIELFSSSENSLGVQVTAGVEASIGANIGGIVEGSTTVNFSTTVDWNETFTTSSTTSQQQTWESSNQGTRSVSHSRDYVVPPNTAVLIRDVVKTVNNVRVPFTQTLRVTGTVSESSRELTGEEIQSQMLFNFVGGVILNVGDNHVDIGMRGAMVIDQIFESTTYVDQLDDVCD